MKKITALNVLPKECLPAQMQVQHVTHSGRAAHTLAQVNESGKAGSQGPANPSTAIGEPWRGQTVSVWTLAILPVGTRHRTCHEDSPRVSPTLPKTQRGESCGTDGPTAGITLTILGVVVTPWCQDARQGCAVPRADNQPSVVTAVTGHTCTHRGRAAGGAAGGSSRGHRLF